MPERRPWSAEALARRAETTRRGVVTRERMVVQKLRRRVAGLNRGPSRGRRSAVLAGAALVLVGLSGEGAPPKVAGPPAAPPPATVAVAVRPVRVPAASSLLARSAAADPAALRFAARFPVHAAATQRVGDPPSTRWAVVVGVNDHAGRTRDNIGSRQDAELLARHLGGLGWRPDHVLLLTDRDATREHIEQAIDWLARKTDAHSTAVVHYSGHVKQWFGADVDGDGEVPDEGLWPSDNRHLPDGALANRLGAVRAGRLWVNIAGCEAAGFLEDGRLGGPGRLLTFSSEEDEKSYEDPLVSLSVWGHHLIQRGLVGGLADADGDGDVTVEEAFGFAAAPAAERSRIGSHGSQHAVIVDAVPGGFTLRADAPPPGSA
ncbi:MAG TPA: caspase family protein [Nitriliruptorales bacterium]|nr:caspase family protein [Nitriliruptorales bacterium]